MKQTLFSSVSILPFLGNLQTRSAKTRTCVTVLPQYIDEISVVFGDRGTVQSDSFPFSCCISQATEIRLTSSNTTSPAYIHLAFDDLDLPPGTNFKIYVRETSRSPLQLYPSQPQYRPGSWRRPFVTTTGAIQIVLRLPYHFGYTDYDHQYYSGFKATYTVTKDWKPLFDSFDDLCPLLVAPGNSRHEVSVRTQLISRYKDRWLDCLWIIKRPIRDELPADWPSSQVQVYLNVLRLETGIQGKMLIYDKPHSASGQSSQFDRTDRPLVSYRGFYVRLILQADFHPSLLSFVYGNVRILDQGFTCAPPSMVCPGSYDHWCLPYTHICNCPTWNQPCPTITATTTATPAATTTATMTTKTVPRQPAHLGAVKESEIIIKCGHQMQFCISNHSCISVFHRCPFDCQPFEKVCKEGSCILPGTQYCPEEHCPSDLPYRCDKVRCLSNNVICDIIVNCDDASDEKDCQIRSDFDHRFVVVLIVLPIVLICILIIFCVLVKRRTLRRQQQNHRRIVQSLGPEQAVELAPLSIPSPAASPNPHSRRYHSDIARHIAPRQDHGSPHQASSHRHHHPVSNQAPSPARSPASLPRAQRERETRAEVQESDDPPPYSEVTRDREPPPPSYDKAIQGPQVHIL